jgi:hypothetical protein
MEPTTYDLACHHWDGSPVVADRSIAPFLIVAFPWLAAVVFGAAWIAGGAL